MLKYRDVQLETRFVERICQHCKYFLLDGQEVTTVKLITKLGCLPQVRVQHVNPIELLMWWIADNDNMLNEMQTKRKLSTPESSSTSPVKG